MNEQLNIAIQYRDTFDLGFLKRDERVRATENAVEVFTKGRWMRVEKGDWPIRTMDGRLVNRKFI